MQFELTEALIDEILFSMEDQNGEFLLDTRENMVIADGDEKIDWDEDAAEGRCISLPEWESSEGFRLMERFTAACKNTVVRDKLTIALDRGKGVFRAFKDALTEHPEAEQLWFAFKEREMRQVIVSWYNALREEWGLERIGTEPEETGDLVLEDFRFRDASEEDRLLAEKLHLQYREELYASFKKSERDSWDSKESPESQDSWDSKESPESPDSPDPKRHGPAKIPSEETVRDFIRECTEDWIFPGSRTIVAETMAGDFAAYITALIQGEALRVAALEVRPEYRGLGIGETLLTRLLEQAGPEISRILMDLPSEAEEFSRVLLRNAFSPYTTRYVRYLR
jgi:GNAT superfamily N-acetyltransferase